MRRGSFRPGRHDGGAQVNGAHDTERGGVTGTADTQPTPRPVQQVLAPTHPDFTYFLNGW
jgi:hypothetical protein